MLRAILAILLFAAIGGIGFYLGRSSNLNSSSLNSPPDRGQVQVNPQEQPAASRTRSRTESSALPEPPPITPEANLSSPVLPTTAQGQVPGDSNPLTNRALGPPIAGLKASAIQDTFAQSRGGGERQHEATDILAPRGTPVHAVDAGIIAKLFTSKPGGLTIYQFDPDQKYVYYYAHLDRYFEGLREGILVKKGDVIGYVGTTGNADPSTPHLHFAILQLGPEKRWWEGNPINPYPLLVRVAR